MKHVLPGAICNLKKIFCALKELNSLARFTFDNNGVSIDSMDSYNTVLLHVTIRALEVKNHSNVRICADGTTVVFFTISKEVLQMLSDYAVSGGVIIFLQENKDVIILDNNQHHEILKFQYAKDYQHFVSGTFKNFSNAHCFTIPYLVKELLSTLLNLNVFSGKSTISLQSSGLLTFFSEFEMGSIKIQKQLKNLELQHALKKRRVNNSSSHQTTVVAEENMFEAKFIIKFIGVLNTLCHSMPKKHPCSLQLFSNDCSARISCDLCSHTSVFFQLKTVVF